ncbi:hypothetical protein MBEHAL_1334 [Halarchaeum acidiphilum MH1-52-1]|uniref:Uncharacterized protein n=1 Tax=Halarchaeum acidiphilum MH1-52-1 TaxID=1261545 RepID=U3A4K5_9EURY|nr:hypothetical protein MBEHAL_1334 [Halarchaeum acidiphilum MH1-52-1]
MIPYHSDRLPTEDADDEPLAEDAVPASEDAIGGRGSVGTRASRLAHETTGLVNADDVGAARLRRRYRRSRRRPR